MTSRDASGAHGPDSPRGPTRRVFFSLWPDAALRTALARATHKAVSASAGRPVPSESLHATLVFIGSVPEQRIPELEELGAHVAGAFSAAAFSAEASTGARTAPPQLIFDRIEYWQKPQIICGTVGAESGDGVAVVRALVDALRKATVDAGFTPDLWTLWPVGDSTIIKFTPHVTLARKVARPSSTADMEPVVWSFTDFALVESRRGPGGSQYTVLAKFALADLQP